MATPDDTQAAPPQDGAPPTKKLHEHAVQAEKHLEQLATGLGQIQAAPQAIKAVSGMADVVRKIATGLAPAVERDDEPEPEPAPEQPHTMDSAADAMMADHRAARQ